MAGRELPELRSRLRLDTKDLTRAEGEAKRFAQGLSNIKLSNLDTRSLDAFASKADKVGASMTRNVTLPVVAAGGAAVKMAVDFNTAFNEMQTLAGVTAGEVDGLKDTVKKLAVETGKSPDDLAKALYFIRSSGLEGATALSVLEASAKGAAIGLGETSAVADAVTSAINTYGAANLSGATAVDVLAAAVAEGKGEAAEFAPQLGRLLPIASTLGVSFGEVTGSLAYLTKGSGDSSLAAANLGGVLAALLKPTQQGQKQLAEMGLSADKLRESVKSNGLLDTLVALNERLDGNKNALGKLFEDREALNGFIALTQNADKSKASVDAVTDSAGYLETQIAKLRGTDEFKLKQDLSELAVSGIEIGEKLLPVLADLADTISSVVGAFTGLPDWLQKSLLGFAALAAVTGPVLKGVSGVAKGVSALSKLSNSKALDGFRLGLQGVDTAGGGLGAKLGGVAGSIGALGPVGILAAGGIAALAAGFLEAQAGAARTKADIDGLVESMKQGASPIEAFNEKLAATLAGTSGGFNLAIPGDELRAQLEQAGIGAKELSAALLGTDDQFESLKQKLKGELGNTAFAARLVGALDALRNKGSAASDQFDAITAANQDLGVGSDDAASAVTGEAGAMDVLGSATADATDEIKEQADAARALFDAHQNVAKTGDDLADAQADLGEAQRAAAGHSAEMESALKRVQSAEEGVRSAQSDSREAQQGVTEARAHAVETLEDLKRAADEAVVSEAEAQLSLDKARRVLQEGNFDGPLDKRAAELAAQRAEVELAQAKDATIDSAAAAAQTVDQTDEVQAALARVTETTRAEQDAREQLGEASTAVAKVQADAADKVKDAEDRVVDAQLAHIDAQADLAEKTDGAAASTDVLIGGLFALAASLDPNNPLRKRLTDYIADLKELQGLFGDPSVNTTSGGIASLGPTASPGAVNAERGLGGPGRIISPSSIPAPATKGVGNAGGNSIVVQVPVTINGGLTDVQAAEVKELVTAGVSDGIRKAPFT